MGKEHELKEHKEPKTPREKNRILAIIMIICGVIYIPYTLMHPELVPYSKEFIYTTYIVYVVVTIIICFMGFGGKKKKVVEEKPKKRKKPKNHIR